MKQFIRKKYVLLTITPFVIHLFSKAALAHIEAGQAGGFYVGFLHPWSGMDHILAMVAVGLWGAQLGAPAIWLLPIVFPIIMSLGAFMGLIGIGLPGVEVGIALSAITLGAMILFEVHPHTWVASLLVGIFAVFHGHAHGMELTPGQNGLLYSMGFVIATGLLHCVGIIIGLMHFCPTGKIIVRCCGGIICGAGFYFLWRALV